MKAVAYYRVSTKKQGESGLGLEAQERDVEQFAKARGFEITSKFIEVETGKNNYRPKLKEAMNVCQDKNQTLLIAKIDRLARNAAFIMNLQESQVKFIAVDMPEANDFVVGIMALVAQQEAKAISDRTKKGLESAKINGKVLGRPVGYVMSKETKDKISRSKRKNKEFEPMILNMAKKLKKEGKTFQQIADDLNALGAKTDTGRPIYGKYISRMLNKSKVKLSSL